MAFLELTGVQKRFGEFAAVHNFDLAAEAGEFVSFLGPSGCGKTTTLRMIAGFERPTAGTIMVNGADITNKAPNQRNVGHGLPVVRAVPEHDRGRQRRIRAEDPEAAQGPDQEAGRRAARADPPARQGEPLSLAAVRRPAAARRARPGAGDRAPGPAPRRAAVGPRREDPGLPAQRDPGDPAPARDHDRLRHPRPGGGAVAVRPDRRDERGPGRADRDPLPDLQLPEHRLRRPLRGHPQRPRGQGRRSGDRQLEVAGQPIRAAQPISRRPRRRRDHGRPPARDHRRSVPGTA